MHELLKATFIFKEIYLLQEHSPNIKANPLRISSKYLKAVTGCLFENILEAIFAPNFSDFSMSHLVQITLFIYSKFCDTQISQSMNITV